MLALEGVQSFGGFTTEQQVTPAAWYNAYVRDSRLVSISPGRTLNLYCIGSGSPIVILESGISESAYTWWAVQGRIARVTRVCGYDRAGLGRSPAGPLPRDTSAEVADLEDLLRAAKLRPPYVFVGHSMAGYNARMFVSKHPNDVAGVVLVDPAVENQIPLLESAAPAIAENDKRQMGNLRACADPARTERIAALCTRKAPDGFPPELAKAYQSTFGLSFFQTTLSEAESFLTRDSQEVSAEGHNLGTLPLIVLTRGSLSSDLPKDQAAVEWKLWNGLHDELAKLSTAGTNRIVADSGHYIQIDKPDSVVAAITEVVTLARKGRHAT